MDKCKTCGKPNESDYVNCDSCRAKAAERKRRSRENRKVQEEKVEPKEESDSDEESDIEVLVAKLKELGKKRNKLIKEKMEILRLLEDVEKEYVDVKYRIASSEQL